MTTQDMDILARKIVSLEKRHNALARAQQLPNSSVRLVDGDDVGLADSAEATKDIGDEAAYLGDWLTDADNNLDDNAEYGVEVPEWIQDAGYAGDVAWDSTQFATDLALQLETELGAAQAELEQAQIDLTQALADSATALQEAQEALQEAEDAVTAVSSATAAASAAEAAAQAAQTAAGTAQTAADQAAADALAAANAASDAQGAADDAQATADAKGKVIIQSGAPNAADRLPQNLWIDTTGGNNTPKRWDGSNWVVVTDKAATDAAAAAVTAQDRADEAYDEALSAATAAGNAQASADGKTTNWYQNDAPAGTAHKVGDTWFDTNDGNRIYRWNGSWVAAQFGTNAISDTAINAAKLAANAVTEGKILNGAITNDKLNSAVQNAITTAQSTASNAQTVANSAQSVANAAQSAASNAQDDADAAQSRADDAHTIASGAATAASAAASAASAAQTAANNAQTTADGKNKIVRSTANASSPGNYVAGDQWWKYSGSQITAMWIHSGSAWVSQTLTDSVITNLNAGSITAGTIASARLSATNIKAVLINAGAIETANIAAGAITAASGIIADAAIGTAKIIDGSITTAKIANLAVTNAEIANGTIQNAKIANLDAAKITTGELDAARIAAGSITSKHLMIGDFSNMVSDPLMKLGVAGDSWVPVNMSWGTQTGAQRSTNSWRNSAGGNWSLTSAEYIPVQPSTSFYLDSEIYRTGAGVISLGLQWYTDTFTAIGSVVNVYSDTTNGWTVQGGSVTAPSNAAYAKIVYSGTGATSSANAHVTGTVLRRMASGELIVDGAITATKISTGAVVADKIASNAVTAVKINANAVTTAKINAGAVNADKIASNAVTADKIAANAVTAGKIQAQAIDGMTITGALIRTAPSGQRVQLDVNGLRTFDSANIETSRLTAAEGGLNLTGLFRNDDDGQSVRIFYGRIQIASTTTPHYSPPYTNPPPLHGLNLFRTGVYQNGWGTDPENSDLNIRNDTVFGDLTLSTVSPGTGRIIVGSPVVRSDNVDLRGKTINPGNTFDLKSQLDAWTSSSQMPPIDGTLAWVTADGSQWMRVGGAWVPTYRTPKILYESGGAYPNATTFTLSESALNFPNGLIFRWSAYSSGAGQNWWWQETVLSRQFLLTRLTANTHHRVSSDLHQASKSISMLNATQFTGSGVNGTGAAANFVLREVIGH